MEEYTRDSLRAYRRELQAGRNEAKRKKGSRWITLLIILLFLAAGAVYLQTEHADRLQDFFKTSVFDSWNQAEETAKSVHQTVDGVLAEQDAAN